MASLTANIHILFSSFYLPTKSRYKILMESKAFGSDSYAVKSQITLKGFDVTSSLIEISPRKGEYCLRTEDILDVIEKEGDEIALVWFGGVHYYTGQMIEMERITKKARSKVR
jgi:kynureninase